MKDIRLSPKEIDAIKKTFLQNFEPSDQLWIFGSRVDPKRKGGDIDLFIETQSLDAKKIVEAKIQFLIDLKNQIGDQKIDVVIRLNNEDRLIYTVAKTEGIRLV